MSETIHLEIEADKLDLSFGGVKLNDASKIIELVKENKALKAENEELRYIVEQFRSWYNENGCPKRLNPDFPCSAETEYNNDPETEGDFNERDCWKEEHEHGCWVEYYRWKYRQKNNNPDTAKGGENE